MSNAHFGSGRYKTTQHFMLLTHCCLKRALPKTPDSLVIQRATGDTL